MFILNIGKYIWSASVTLSSEMWIVLGNLEIERRPSNATIDEKIMWLTVLAHVFYIKHHLCHECFIVPFAVTIDADKCFVSKIS